MSSKQDLGGGEKKSLAQSVGTVAEMHTGDRNAPLSSVPLTFFLWATDRLNCVRSFDHLTCIRRSRQCRFSVATSDSHFANLEAEQKVADSVFVNIFYFVANRLCTIGAKLYGWNIDLRRRTERRVRVSIR